MKARALLGAAWPWVGTVAAGFSLAWLFMAFVVFPGSAPVREVSVPNVMGLAYDDAARRVSTVGLVAVRGTGRYHEATPKETVLDQDPRADTKIGEGGDVTLIVSLGQRTGTVPTVVGLSQEDAEQALERVGFVVGDVSEAPSEAPRGQVVESRPAAGTRTRLPGAVALVISAGLDTIARMVVPAGASR